MNIIISLEGHEALPVSEEMRQLVATAYHRGIVVAIPASVIESSCADLSSETSDAIKAIRRNGGQALGARMPGQTRLPGR